MPTNLPLQSQDKHDRPGALYLRRLAATDKEKVCQWMASAYILHHSFVLPGPQALTRDFGTKAYAERYFNLLLSEDRRQTFAIILGDQHIGTVGIKEIDKHDKAECFIEIGEGEYRGKGLGRLAMINLLNIAFGVVKLKQLTLDVLEFNIAALKLYHGLGFLREDQITWHYDKFGLYWQVLRMNLPSSAWMQQRNW